MKQSGCIFSETITGFRFKSFPYRSMYQGDLKVASYVGSASRRLGDWILQAAKGSRQIVLTSYSEILYTNIRQPWEQQQYRIYFVRLPTVGLLASFASVLLIVR